MGKESKFESDFKKDVEKIGGACIKIRSIENGWMDRLVLMPNGKIYFVELKRPDGKGVVAKLQLYQKNRLLGLRHISWIIDSEATKDNFISTIIRDQEGFEDDI